MTFRVGQKVTQIKPINWHVRRGEAVPQFGVVYTIRTIDEYSGFVFLRFYEIKNPVERYSDGTVEMDFWDYYFRPVLDRPADISIFKKMLTPAQEPACTSS